MMYKDISWRELVTFVIVFGLYWCLGWGMQGFACFMRKTPHSENLSKGSFDEAIDAKWYWRLLLGCGPTNGKVAIRPAMIQLLAILMIIVGLALALIYPQHFHKLAPALGILYWPIAIVLLIFLNNRSPAG